MSGGEGAAAEAKTKGVGFSNVRAFTNERFGAGGWDATLARVDPSDRAELMSVVPVGWYPLALYARLIRAVDETHGYGDLSLVVQLGRFEAERDLTTIHRLILRLANPSLIVMKTGEYWRRFHDTGRWILTRESPAHVTGFLDGWGVVDHALCRELVGYMGRCLELVGAKNVLFEHPACRANGAEHCFFQARWGHERVDIPASAASAAASPARGEPHHGPPESAMTPEKSFRTSRALLRGERDRDA